MFILSLIKLSWFERNCTFILTSFLITSILSIDALTEDTLNLLPLLLLEFKAFWKFSYTSLLIKLFISSNGSSDIEIPVMLSVVLGGGMLGDLNDDSSINVQDIILLVALILDSGDYIENADINMDGVLDVIDVVQLVSVILDSWL